jgi:hypothetical protein
VVANGLTDTRTAADAGVRYRANDRSFVEVSGSYLTQEVETGNDIAAAADLSYLTLTGLAQFAGPSIASDFDITLALRAISPPNDAENTSWITRFDGRISYAVNVRGISGALWLNAYRLAGSTQFLDNPLDLQARNSRIGSDRATLGNGQLVDVVNLSSLVAAGDGVRNEVDLYLLQQAESRFGNGDLQFSAEEQTRAFGAAFDFEATTLTPLSQSRRFELGIELSF